MNNKQILALLDDIIGKAEGLVVEALVIDGGCIKRSVIVESEKILKKVKLAKSLLKQA